MVVWDGTIILFVRDVLRNATNMFYCLVLSTLSAIITCSIINYNKKRIIE